MNRLALLSALVAVCLSSCGTAPLPGGALPAMQLSTTPAPPTASATVAFPTLIPTATWTSGPSLTPTADLRPAIGPVILQDRMDDPSAWDLTTSATGGAAITDGRLTLSVRTARGLHEARRDEPIVGDFYAEVDAFTEVCTPGDELGLTARGRGAGEQYRFLIGCDGTARITRVLEEGSRALTLRLPSPTILPGAPTRHHLAIWLHGTDLTFFVSGEEVASVRDAALDRGTLGLIARAGPGGQVSASFDDLRVYELTNPEGPPDLASTRAASTLAPTTASP
jgi:hypothetical protein